jgi:hypothetical protein
MTEYIERKALDKALTAAAAHDKDKNRRTWAKAICILHDLPAADVAPVVRCKDCKHSTLPSELTQRYGKPGTLTCHNMHAPSNRRNVGSNDFCSYGARMDGDSDALD